MMSVSMVRERTVVKTTMGDVGVRRPTKSETARLLAATSGAIQAAGGRGFDPEDVGAGAIYQSYLIRWAIGGAAGCTLEPGEKMDRHPTLGEIAPERVYDAMNDEDCKRIVEAAQPAAESPEKN